MAPKIIMETLELPNPAQYVEFVSHDALLVGGSSDSGSELTLAELSNGVPNVTAECKIPESKTCIGALAVSEMSNESMLPPYDSEENENTDSTTVVAFTILKSTTDVKTEDKISQFAISAPNHSIKATEELPLYKKTRHVQVRPERIDISRPGNFAAVQVSAGVHSQIHFIDLRTQNTTDFVTLPSEYGPVTDLSLRYSRLFFTASGKLYSLHLNEQGKVDGDIQEHLFSNFSKSITHVRNLGNGYAFIGNRSRNDQDPARMSIWVRSHGKMVPSLNLPKEFSNITCFETLHLPAESKPEQWVFAVAAGRSLAIYTYTKVPDGYPRLQKFRIFENVHEFIIKDVAFSPVRRRAVEEVEKRGGAGHETDIETISLASVSGTGKLVVVTMPIIKTPNGRYINIPKKWATADIFLSFASMAVVGIFLQYLFGASIIGLLV